MRDLGNVIEILLHLINSKFRAVRSFLSSEKWSWINHRLEAPLLVSAVVDSIEVINELFKRQDCVVGIISCLHIHIVTILKQV